MDNNEDLSSLFEKFNINKDSISPDMINNLMNMLNGNSNSSNENTDYSECDNNESNQSSNGIDFETILKMKTIIDKMNIQDDPRSHLLQSLKPYLNENRKSKVDQYIKLMNMSRVMEVFPFFGGDNPNVRK